MAVDSSIVLSRSRVSDVLVAYWPQLSMAIVLLLAGVIRFHGLTTDGLWLDEIAALEGWTPNPSSTIEAIVAGNVPESPLHIMLVQGWLGLVGSTTFLARSFSVLCGVASVYLLYATGRVLFDRRVGVLAALVLALSPLHIQYSREARFLALLFLCSTLSFYFFARLLSGDRSRTVWAGYVLSCVLLVCTHVTGVFVILAHNVLVVRWILPRGWPDRIPGRAWLTAQALIVVGSLPWLGTFVWHVRLGNTEPFSWFAPPTLGQFAQTLLVYAGRLATYPFAVHDPVSHTLSIVVLGCLVVLGAYSFITYTPENVREWHQNAPFTAEEPDDDRTIVTKRIVRSGDANADDTVVRTYLQREYVVLCWAFVPILAPYVISHVFVPVFHLEYAFVSLGGLALVAAHGVTRIDRRSLRWLLVTLLLVGLVASAGVYVGAETQEDWPGTAATVDASPDEPIFVTPGYTADALVAYTDRPPETVLDPPDAAVGDSQDPFVSPEETINETETALAETPGDGTQFWVVAPQAYEHEDEWITDLEAAAAEYEYYEHGEIDTYRFSLENNETE
ncbi:Dolichyl-phosphate-mannose-protein mannosyltransferase [Natronorubrum sediminis]|uniref:Dolichyl-phosphate-mannose-protein mannosyltransferase n=1 Tax=Natronorubrum sediminis TaxID=640943 RepID=A0A1H6G0K2_9EURY|nr:Dolichyl-phosphate-mannose-protein mannosyltransferase [Natronorubrum sediminis]